MRRAPRSARAEAERADLGTAASTALEPPSTRAARAAARAGVEASSPRSIGERPARRPRSRKPQARTEALAAGRADARQRAPCAGAGAQHASADLEAEIARVAADARSGAHQRGRRLDPDAPRCRDPLDGLRVDLAEAAQARDELQRALGDGPARVAHHQRALAELAAERTRLPAPTERRERRAQRARHRSTTAAHRARHLMKRATPGGGARRGAGTDLRTVRESSSPPPRPGSRAGAGDAWRHRAPAPPPRHTTRRAGSSCCDQLAFSAGEPGASRQTAEARRSSCCNRPSRISPTTTN